MKLFNRQFSVLPAAAILLLALLLAMGGAALAQDRQPDHIPELAALFPVVANPGKTEGEIKFSSPQFAGVTTFIPTLTLDFSDLKTEPQPDEMKVYFEGEDPATVAWVPVTAAYSKDFVPVANGIQRMNVAFRTYEGFHFGYAVFFFYIPGADFALPDRDALADLGWTLVEGGLPYYVENGALRLGSEQWGCDNIPYNAFAAAAIDWVLPEHGDYHLRVNATITTYDQLPHPAQDEYDAFEIYLDGTLLGRYGNPDAPLDCGTERKIALLNAYDLQSFAAGETTLRFENHNRYDEFYNTYTDIQQVWVDAGDPPPSSFTASSRQLQQLRLEDVGVVGPVRRE